MIIIAGHWELSYMTPIQEAFYWNFVLRDFEVKRWMMTPVSGIRHAQESTVELLEYPTTDDMLNAFPELPRIFFEPRTDHQNPDTIWLHEFEHPENCIYIFGSGAINPTMASGNVRSQDKIVSIKTINDKGIFWGNQTMCIALYDRLLKSMK